MNTQNITNNHANVKLAYWNNPPQSLCQRKIELDYEYSLQNSLGNNAFYKNQPQISAFKGMVQITDPSCVKDLPIPPDRSPNDIIKFSKNSRLRMLRLSASIDFDSYADCRHVTITYHNNFPTDSESIKKIFHHFWVRLNQSFQSCHFIWRLEFQRRGAPHYHIIFLSRFKKFNKDTKWLQCRINRIWRSIIKEYSHAHWLHGTKVTELQDWRKFFLYISKYAAKVEFDDVGKYSGRRWGYSDDIFRTSLDEIHPSIEFMKIFKKNLLNFLRREKRLSEKLEKCFHENVHLSIFIDYSDFKNIIDMTLSHLSRPPS